MTVTLIEIISNFSLFYYVCLCLPTKLCLRNMNASGSNKVHLEYKSRLKSQGHWPCYHLKGFHAKYKVSISYGSKVMANVKVFSAPEPKAQVHYCDRALSVVRPSSLTFHIFDFSSETVEQNLTKLDRKIDLNALYQVCVFRSDRKNKMAALASDWPKHFRLLLWNRWTEFNENWQEARSQCPLPSLCFSERSEKQDGRPGLWLAETFLTSHLKPLNGIQRNLTGSKISTHSTKFVFFGPI